MSKFDEPLLIMEYMENGSLYDLLHNETVLLEGRNCVNFCSARFEPPFFFFYCLCVVSIIKCFVGSICNVTSIGPFDVLYMQRDFFQATYCYQYCGIFRRV